jgi:low temperature requirement protein LtrA
MRINKIDSWGAIAIGSSVLCFNNFLNVLTTNSIIEVINACFQVLISVSTLVLCFIKIRNEILKKNEKKDNID